MNLEVEATWGIKEDLRMGRRIGKSGVCNGIFGTFFRWVALGWSGGSQHDSKHSHWPRMLQCFMSILLINCSTSLAFGLLSALSGVCTRMLALSSVLG